jgi:hypothetical protein
VLEFTPSPSLSLLQTPIHVCLEENINSKSYLVHTCMCAYVCVCVCVCVPVYVCDLYVYVCVHVCARAYMWICMCVHVHMCVDPKAHTQQYM